MLYNNRLYPHPVLGIGNDINGSIEVELRVASSGKQIEISPAFKITNDTLQTLVEKKQAMFVSHLYCRGTMYREVFKSEKNISDTIRINSYKLNGEVEMDFFICANENISSYSNKEFHPDYNRQSFSIDKGDILAYAGKGKFYANKSPEELKSISALMNISSTGKSSHPMYNDYTSDKITIMLCQEDYENYQIVKRSVLWVNILLSCIVLPALTEALHYISTSEANDFADKRWHKVLSELKEKSKDNTEIEMAQRILEQPNNRSFNTIKQLIEEA
ncbi:MAG TPA: hypothetical protein VG847_13045 [Chitinophagaceae bacterium]|nr:hypothetical protein [Chitinophagaceae bacterium]